MNKKMFVFISILFSFLVFTNIDNVGAQELIHTAEYQQYFREYESISPEEEDWYIKKCSYVHNSISSDTVDLYIRKAGEIIYNGHKLNNVSADPKFAMSEINETAECPSHFLLTKAPEGGSINFSSESNPNGYTLDTTLPPTYIRGDVQYCAGTLYDVVYGEGTTKKFSLSVDANAANGNEYSTKDQAFEGFYYRKLGGDKDHYTNGNDSEWEFKDVPGEFSFSSLSDYVDFIKYGCSEKYVYIIAGWWGAFELRLQNSAPTMGWGAAPGTLESNSCFDTLYDSFDDYNTWGIKIEKFDKDVNSVIYDMKLADGIEPNIYSDGETSSIPDSQLTDDEQKAIYDELDRLIAEITTLNKEIAASKNNYGECEIQPYLNDTTTLEGELDSILERITGEEFEKLKSDFGDYNKLSDEEKAELDKKFDEIEKEVNQIVEVTETSFDIPGTNVEVDCNTLFGVGTPLGDILREILTWMQILAPIALIVLGSLDFGQVVLSGDQEALKKAGSKFMKRCIAAVGLFFVPLMLKIILDTDLLGIESNCIEELTTTEQSGSNSNDESSVNGNVIHTPQ